MMVCYFTLEAIANVVPIAIIELFCCRARANIGRLKEELRTSTSETAVPFSLFVETFSPKYYPIVKFRVVKKIYLFSMHTPKKAVTPRSISSRKHSL